MNAERILDNWRLGVVDFDNAELAEKFLVVVFDVQVAFAANWYFGSSVGR